jgi:hypothetical protein
MATLTVDSGSYLIVGSASVNAYDFAAATDAYTISGTDAGLIYDDGTVVQHLLACLGAGN